MPLAPLIMTVRRYLRGTILKFMQWISFLIIISLCLLSFFFPETYKFNNYTISVVFIIAIPLIAPFLKRAKFFGNEFDFKSEIKSLSLAVTQSEEVAQEKSPNNQNQDLELEVIPTSTSESLLDSDPVLSLAALRIDVEKIVGKLFKLKFQDLYSIKTPFTKMIDLFVENRVIHHEQGKALITIYKLCSEAIHGAKMEKDDAVEVISLVKRLNSSFSIGYFINTNKNELYQEHELLCPWQHCVELFPVSSLENPDECHVFGHECPGGRNFAAGCEINQERVRKNLLTLNAPDAEGTGD